MFLTATTSMDDLSTADATGEKEDVASTTIELDRGIGQSVAFDESVQGYQSDITPSSSGADLMATVVSLLRSANIQCCFAREAALIYYGAHRNMMDWILCVEDEKLADATELLAEQQAIQPFRPSAMIPNGTIDHHFPRFKFLGFRCFFHLVPASIHRLSCSLDCVEISKKGLPFPKLDVLAQSLIETMDYVDLDDLVDGMNLTYEWGLDNLDLEGLTDTEWAQRRHDFHDRCGEWPPIFLRKDGKPKGNIWLRVASPESKKKRRGHKALPKDETRFRQKGQKDPRELHMW